MEKQCALIGAIGSTAECPHAWCAFWEKGDGCQIERLGIDLTNRPLAFYLLDLRRALEGTRDAEAAEQARRELALLAPPELSGA